MGTTQAIYRAKRKDNGEWVEGYYAKAKDYLSGKNIHVIFSLDLELYPHSEFSSYEEIIPETLGRLLEYPCYDSDYANKRFFQGDIIAVYRDHFSDIKDQDPDTIALVIDEHTISEHGYDRWFPQDTTRVRVIGNAYDHSELLNCRDKRRIMLSQTKLQDNYDHICSRLIHTYGIHGTHAKCYLCNFENNYFCYQYNGGCYLIEECERIHESEFKNGGVKL